MVQRSDDGRQLAQAALVEDETISQHDFTFGPMFPRRTVGSCAQFLRATTRAKKFMLGGMIGIKARGVPAELGSTR